MTCSPATCSLVKGTSSYIFCVVGEMDDLNSLCVNILYWCWWKNTGSELIHVYFNNTVYLEKKKERFSLTIMIELCILLTNALKGYSEILWSEIHFLVHTDFVAYSERTLLYYNLLLQKQFSFDKISRPFAFLNFWCPAIRNYSIQWRSIIHVILHISPMWNHSQLEFWT